MFKLSVHNDIADDNHSLYTFGSTGATPITVPLLSPVFFFLQNVYNAMRPIITTIPLIISPIVHLVNLKYNNNMKIHL